MNAPKLPRAKAAELLAAHAPAVVEPVRILAVRGYRRDTMGLPGKNDVGLYDDAMFLLTPTVFRAVNANTDPSRLGWNAAIGKPYAMLVPGLWYFIRGPHKGKRPALRQADHEEDEDLRFNIPDQGHFEVERSAANGRPAYRERGYFAINIHSGGDRTTSSWGCQTIPPESFFGFMSTVWEESLRAKQQRIPYLLINGPVV